MKAVDFLDSPNDAGLGSAESFLGDNSPGSLDVVKKGLSDIGLKLNIGTTVDIPEQVIGINDLARKTTPLGMITEAVMPGAVKKLRSDAETVARDGLNARRKSLSEELSPEQKTADAKSYFTDEASWANLAKDGLTAIPGKVLDLGINGKLFGDAWSDWRKPIGGAAESFPGALVTMGPTAKMAGGIADRVFAETLAKTGSEAAAKAAATKAAENAAMVAGGLSEGLQGAGSANEQTRRSVMEMPIDKLQASPYFQQALKANGGNVDAARTAAADQAATTSAGVAFLFDSTFGALGDRYIGTAAAGNGSRAGAMVRGGIQETPTEFIQSGGEKFGENLGIRQFADPSQPLMKDVGEEAVGGAMAGGLTGVAMGGAMHRNAGAPVVNPPQLPDTGPLSRSANIALATTAAPIPSDASSAPGSADIQQESTPDQDAKLQRLAELELQAEQRALTPAEVAEAQGIQAAIDQADNSDSTVTAEESASASPVNSVSAEAITSHASSRLAELELATTGTKEQIISGPDGKPMTIPGEQPRYFTQEEQAEYKFLKDNAGNPEALAKGYGVTLEAPATAVDPVMAAKTDQQLKNLSGLGHSKATRQAASDEIARRAAANTKQADIPNGDGITSVPLASGENATAQEQKAAPAADISGQKLTKEWTAFSDDSGSLGIPRAEMPQIKSEHRGAMTQFMNARGISHQQEEVPADSLKPTQAEFSPAKVELAAKREGGDRSILVSSDNYVLDGHHQWLAKRDSGDPIKIIRLNAPIHDLIGAAHEFPSSQVAGGALKTVADSKKASTGPASRDDLLGAILRVTGNKGIAANMAQTIVGDKANQATKVRGLFQNQGTMDLDDTAELLRTQEGYDVRDGNHLAELIRQQADGNPVYSLSRSEREAAAAADKQHRDEIRRQAKKLGVKQVARPFSDIEQEVIDLLKQRHNEAVAKLDVRARSRYDAMLQRAMEIADYDELDAIITDAQNRYSGRQFYNEATKQLRGYIDDLALERQAKEQGNGTEEDTGTTVEPDWLRSGTEDAGRRSAVAATLEGAQGGTRSTGSQSGNKQEGLTLTGQTNEQAAEQFARQQSGEPAEPTKEQADRERDAVPFSMQQESQPKPQGVQTGLFTADGRVSSDARQDASLKDNQDVEHETGPFGPILTEFRHNAKGAIEKLSSLKNGEAIAALSHKDIGDIDLVWGKEGTGESDGFGLSKLLKYHPEIVARLQETLDATSIVKRTANRIQLESDDHKAAVRLEWDGIAKNWLLTAFEKNKESRTGTRTDTADTDVAGDTARRNSALDSSVASATVDSKPATIDDFGEKLDGAKKDRAPSLSQEISDSDLASLPLSKIWPADEIDGMENKFSAAVAFAARSYIPSKPRKDYLVKRWVDKVQLLRGLAQKIVSGQVSEADFRSTLFEFNGLEGFKDKVALLEAIDRDQWKRIGEVRAYPNAYRYGENGEKIPAPSVRIEVDGKSHQFDDAVSVADIVEKVNDLLGVAAQAKKMQFEVRGRGSSFFINKAGDKEYRKLKTFSTSKEAFAFIKENYDDLVAAWDSIKERDNVTKADMRNADNRPRTGQDWRQGKDVTEQQFGDAFGFRGVQFGNWVGQGAGVKDRQGMLNQAYDALMDLASIVGVPPQAISLNGSLGLSFGARGSGNASAHFEPNMLVINLTKTKGAGSLAHEWFHALDNYFSRQRGGEVKIKRGLNAQQAYRNQNYITYRPEPMYVHKSGRSTPMTKAQLERMRAENPKSGYFAAENWQVDPSHPEGVRPEVERAFADLVEALDESPMRARSAMNDKGEDGYWSRIIERSARSFENYVIAKMMENGYHNDYLANVKSVDDFPRAKERYPYLLPEEVKPIAEAFDNLFSTVNTKETESGVAMFSRGEGGAGMALRDLQAVVDRVGKRLKNLPRVHVLESPASLSTKDPVQKSLRDFIRKAGAWNDAEGATHEGDIYLFASGLADEARAEHVLAVHEVTHYGLRGTVGKDLDMALQDVWAMNAKVRRAAAELKERNGLNSNIDATEEILADMAPGDLVKLMGWRRIVKSIRDWLSRVGFERLAEQFDALMKAGMSEQEKADVMVADLVNAARDWVRNGKGRPFMDGTRLADGSLSEDLAKQEQWLLREAKVRGFQSIDEMSEKDTKVFDSLTKLWREKHPLKGMPPSQNGEAMNQRTTGFDKASGTVIADFKNDYPMKVHADYKAAKGGDVDAAARLVQALVKPESIQEAKEAFGEDVIYAPVHAEEASGKNQIPNMLALHYSVGTGAVVDDEITQTNRAFHTGANAMERLLARSEFGGTVEAGRRYVLVDDVTTMGSTLADLASYIRSQGGEVAGSVVLVNAARSGMMIPASKTIRELEARHGDEIRKLFGIEPSALAASEAQYLLGFRTTDELRNRVAKAKQERLARLRAKGVLSESEDPQGSVTPRLSRASAPQPNQSAGSSNNQPPTRWQAAKQKFADLTSPDSLNTLVYNFQNKYVDLKNLQERIKQLGGTLTDLNDAYLGEEMYHGKVMKKTADFLDAELRPLLQQLFNNSIKKEDFETFLHARHAPEANKALAERNPTQAMIDAGKQAAESSLKALQIQLQSAKAKGQATKSIEQAIEKAQAEKSKWSGAQAFQGTEDERLSLSGMSDAAAAQVMASIPPGKRATMDAAAAKVDAIQAKTLAELEKYGLMDKASLDAWRKEYQYYIPLHRDEAHPDSASHPIGQGFSVKGDAAKRRTGSNEKVTNILGHIAMQREAAITRGEKNSVSKRLWLQASQNPDKDFWSVDRPPMLKTIDQRTGFVRSQVDPTYKNKPNVLMLRIAGRDAAIVFNERNPEAVRLAGALKNLDGQDLDIVERTIGSATRWFAAVNTQYNPIFGIINLLRDSQSGILNLTSTALGDKKGEVAKRIPAALKAIYQIERGGQPGNAAMAALWQEFQAVGGQTGYRDLYASPEDRVKALDKELKALERGNLSKRMHAVADWLSDYNTVMENGVRLAAYATAIDHGMSKERAASLAKNLTVNFNRKGAKAAKLGAFYAFFNASVQGTERLAKTMVGPAGRKILMAGVALGVLQQVLGMLFMGGGDDDEWDKIPDFVKERSLIFPVGSGHFVTIPMPLGFNVLPNIGRLATEWALGGKDKPTGKQIGQLMNIVIGSFNPLGGSDVVDMVSPTVADPVIALLRNKDWTGKPIYREDMASLDPTPGFTRTKDSATPWSKGISYVVNWASGGTDYQPGAWSPTPDQIDYVIGQLTGGVGRELGKAVQTGAAITGLSNDELPVHKIPLAGRLVGSTNGPSGQSEKFYENIRELNGIEREIKGRVKDGKDVSAYVDAEPKSALVGVGNEAESNIRHLREERRLLSKQGDTAGAKEIDGVIATVMKGLNMKMHQAAK